MKNVIKTFKYAFKTISSPKGIMCIIFLIVISLLISIGNQKFESLVNIIPSILGIIIAGVLSTLAIIISHINNRELDAFLKAKYTDINDTDKDYYGKFIESVFQDISVVLVAFIISLMVLFLYDADIPYITYPLSELIAKQQFYIALDIFFMFLSILALIDLTWSIYNLMILRYKLADNDFKLRNSSEKLD